MNRFIFAEPNTLIEIERGIAARLDCPYASHEWIVENGYLSVHESYEAQIMQVLQEFAGRYEIKRAVFSEPDEEGNVTITWEKLNDSRLLSNSAD